MDAAHLVRMARRRSGISQRELALRAGVARSTIGAIEAGRHAPTIAVLDRLLAVGGLEHTAMVRLGSAVDRDLLAHLHLSLTQRLRLALGESHVLSTPARSAPWKELGALSRRGQVVLEPPLAHALWLPTGRVERPLVSVFHAKTALRAAHIGVRLRTGEAPPCVIHLMMEIGEPVWVLPPGELALVTEQEAQLRHADLLLHANAPLDDAARRRPAHRDPDEAGEDWRMLRTKSVLDRPDMRAGRGWRLNTSASLAQRLRDEMTG